jgi:hypothetical protein
MKWFWLAVFLLLIAKGMQSQTISPIVVECGLKCSGEFHLTNNSTKPMIAMINVYGFHMVAGHPVQIPLDAQTLVKLDQTSARISPQDSHTFGYKVFCSQEPCMIQLVASMVIGKPAGVQVRLQLPHVVYACQKQKDCRTRALGIK